MRRALLHRHGRFVYFLFLILCIPVFERDDHLPKYQEKWRFFCKQSDLNDSAPSFILESFIAKESPSPAQPNQTLNKTLWALKVDREVWHGELIATQQGFLPQEVGQWNKVENSHNSWQALVNSAAERDSRDQKGMLVMHCNSRNSNIDSTGHNHSTRGKCSRTLQLRSSISTIAEEPSMEKVQFLIRPTPDVFHTMAFQLHNRCSWPHEGYSSSAVLSFFHENKAVQRLELDFNSSLFPSLKHVTIKDWINRLLDERSTKYACNQGMSREFTVKNMRSLPLKVHSLMIKGVNSGIHGFKVEHFDDFYLGPGQSTKLLVSYWPDLKTGFADAELQLVTSAGILPVTLKANVPKHIQSLCQNASLMTKAKKITLQVCSLALFLVLLVFGRMLQQEGLIMSDTSQWSPENNATKLSQRANERSLQYHDDKRPSIYVSIDIGCTQNESKQCSLSLTKALDVVHAAINCIVGLKLLYISQASNVQQPEVNTTSKSNLHTQHDNDSTSPTSSMMGKKRASTPLRACTKPASTNYSGGALSLRSKACSMNKTASQIDVTRFPEKTEPESPSAAHSDKEKEKAKQRKRKKGVPSLVPGMDIGSDSGSSSPLSTPSSPVNREATCRPVSPLCSGTRAPTQKGKMPLKMDATVMILIDKDERRASQTHCSLGSNFSTGDNCSVQETESNFILEDSQANNSYASYAGNFSKSLNQEGKRTESKFMVTSSERNLAKVAAVRHINKGIATTRGRAATLTASATFPAPGRRSLQARMCMGQEDSSMVWSSSNSDLVSTSVMAPHARAPGSPLSPKSPSFSTNTLSSSLFTAPSSSRQYMQHSNTICTIRSDQRGDSQGKARYPRDMFYRSGYGRSNPHQIYEPHYAQKRQEPHHHASDSVILYDMWGDHFADLGRRWGPYWIGKDAPITKKPSSLPPLLQTPPFSVFSCNDPFNR